MYPLYPYRQKLEPIQNHKRYQLLTPPGCGHERIDHGLPLIARNLQNTPLRVLCLIQSLGADAKLMVSNLSVGNTTWLAGSFL